MLLKVFTFTIVTFLVVSCQKAKKDEEDNPYEFGFTIDGQQHRHEKKDVNGIIEGQFGFITADGIYHTTVYATDENGNFRILSMRNVRISAPLDGSPLPEGQKISSLDQPNAAKSPQVQAQAPVPTPAPVAAPVSPTKHPNAPFAFTPLSASTLASCGSCGAITTQKPLKPGSFDFQTPQFQKPGAGVSAGAGGAGEGGQSNGNIPAGLPQTQQPNSPNVQNQQGNNPQYLSPPASIDDGQSTIGGSPAAPGSELNPPFSAQAPPDYNNNEVSISGGNINNPQSRPQSPLSQVSVSNGAIHVPGNADIPIKDKYPGMVDGLPNGIKEKDITDLLYKFNYTVGFHGHYEKGLKSGAKIGGYFVTGRDGLSQIVTYVADENGFRPKVKFVRLDLNSDEVPKEGTEKTFGLKHFEFVWYPIS